MADGEWRMADGRLTFQAIGGLRRGSYKLRLRAISGTLTFVWPVVDQGRSG